MIRTSLVCHVGWQSGEACRADNRWSARRGIRADMPGNMFQEPEKKRLIAAMKPPASVAVSAALLRSNCSSVRW